tara:strand:+ start:997 stop:1233 length:237 start_codon:yes stop_codon:yes gene_type:complete
MKKTFKIGECCVGGIIQLIISDDKTVVRIRNATMQKETIEIRVFRWPLDLFNIEMFLNGLTTSYYASKIMEWIEGKTK